MKEIETYQDWLIEHQKQGGGYEQIVKACLTNVLNKGSLSRMNIYFEINKKEK